MKKVPYPKDLVDAAAGGNGHDSPLLPTSVKQIKSVFKLAERMAQGARAARGATDVPSTSIPALAEDADLRWAVYSMFISGWTAETVSNTLVRSRGLLITVEQLLEFRSSIPSSQFLPATYLRERFKGSDVAVDPVGEINRVLRLMHERLGAATLLEEIEGFPASSTTSLAVAYFDMLLKSAKLQQSLGDLPQRDYEGTPYVRGDTNVSIRVLIAEARRDRGLDAGVAVAVDAQVPKTIENTSMRRPPPPPPRVPVLLPVGEAPDDGK